MLFVGTFFICQFVLMMQFVWRYVDELIGKGLSVEILAQFFWNMALMLVPQALPLAILLSSLITFGNLGESYELTAIKSAGISLMQSFRSLITITLVVCGVSFYFQNNIGPEANMKLSQLLISMKQKSPELMIPEGIFYDGIPNCNIYVQKKDMETGKLYGMMIYRMTGSYEDQAIILADSGMMQTTAEKKHLLLTLWSGEWFENMQSSEFGNSASVPYRRESFVHKQIVLDFDGDFNIQDASALANNAKGKGLRQIFHDMDSISLVYDSIGRSYYDDAKRVYFNTLSLNKADSLNAVKMAKADKTNFDSLFAKKSVENQRFAVNDALNSVQGRVSDLEFRSMITSDGDRLLRMHKIEAINKFTLALQCLLFFFIGAPLGAIIRKGGLGYPILISVLVFIVYYILDNSGYRMARGGMWTVWFGKGLAPVALTPIAIFVTYKANKDSVVFNSDLYKEFLMRLLGLRLKRHVFAKEVIINDPDYANDAIALKQMNADIDAYSKDHRLVSAPNIIDVFFKYKKDNEIERISDILESVIEDLANTKDKILLHEMNKYPILATKAHTRPFEHKWLNIIAGVLVPVGVVLYIRMWSFRLRLYRDLRQIRQTNQAIIVRMREIK